MRCKICSANKQLRTRLIVAGLLLNASDRHILRGGDGLYWYLMGGIVGHCVVPARHAARLCRASTAPRCAAMPTVPCYGPGLRPTTRHMGRLPVPCRPWATTILSCRAAPWHVNIRRHNHSPESEEASEPASKQSTRRQAPLDRRRVAAGGGRIDSSTTHMVHRRRRREGQKGGRRGTEGEGVAGEVSRSPEQWRRAQGEQWRWIRSEIRQERER
jgi:hypothetical protein